MSETVSGNHWRAKWLTVRWTRMSTVLALTLLCPMLAAWYLEPWYIAHRLGSMSPGLGIVPTDVPDRTVAQLSPIRLSPPGYVLQLTVGELVEHGDTMSGSVARYKNGCQILAMPPTNGEGFASQSRRSSDRRRRALIHLLGEQTMRSDYQALSGALQATPTQVRWWARRLDQRTALLLSVKWIEVGSSQAVYRIGNDEVRGFEFVDSATAPRMIKLKLFDETDHQYEVLIHQTQTGPPLRQADINAIVASMRPIPHG